MEHEVSKIIENIAKSHQEMSRILQAERDMVVHMANLFSQIPDIYSFQGEEGAAKNAITVTVNITSYLNGLADFEEAIAENMKAVMKEMIPINDGE